MYFITFIIKKWFFQSFIKLCITAINTMLKIAMSFDINV